MFPDGEDLSCVEQPTGAVSADEIWPLDEKRLFLNAIDALAQSANATGCAAGRTTVDLANLAKVEEFARGFRITWG